MRGALETEVGKDLIDMSFPKARSLRMSLDSMLNRKNKSPWNMRVAKMFCPLGVKLWVCGMNNGALRGGASAKALPASAPMTVIPSMVESAQNSLAAVCSTQLV